MKKAIIIWVFIASAIAIAIALKIDKLKSAEKHIIEMLMSKEEEKLEEEKTLFAKLRTKADSALLFAKEKGFDLEHVFLVDFSLHSGKHRLFVWNVESDSIQFSSLCAHGVGKGNKRSTYTNIIFSNVKESYCSSLGKYKTGARSYSNWGINVHYKLHGLEESNCNAFERLIVLHSHSPISEGETYPDHLPLGYSLGCPVISDQAMQKIDSILKTKKKPVLLWIYI